MKYRVTCRVCHKSPDSESPGTRANWAVQHTVQEKCPPLWDVEDVPQEVPLWQSA